MNLKSLIARVNPCTRDALEGAAGLCMSRTNYDVEVEHFVLKLLDPEGSDFVQILRRFEVNESTLRRDLTRSLDRMKTGNGRMPSLSTRVVRLLGDAWMRTSIDFEAPQIRTGHVLLALVGEDDNARLAREISAELAKVTPDALASRFADLTCGTMEEKGAAGAAAAAERGTPGAAVKGGALDLYTVDLTGRAREGKLDPVLGRDREVRLMIDILTRKRQNNPILTGEAGVGKTAVVEGFAQRVVSGDVPPPCVKSGFIPSISACSRPGRASRASSRIA